MFGAEASHIADKSESQDFDHVLWREYGGSPSARKLISERYIPSESEKKYLKELTGERSLENLYVLNPGRFTDTLQPDLLTLGLHLVE